MPRLLLLAVLLAGCATPQPQRRKAPASRPAAVKPRLPTALTTAPPLRIVLAVDLQVDGKLIRSVAAKRRARRMAAALAEIRSRVAAVTPKGRVRRDGDRVLVDLPRLSRRRLAQLKQLLRLSPILTFRPVDDAAGYLKRVAARIKPPSAVKVLTDSYSAGGKTVTYTYLAAPLADLRAFFARRDLPRPPADREVLFGACKIQGHPAKQHETFYLEKIPWVTSFDINDATYQWDARSGRPEVGMTLSVAAAKRFERLTRANVGRRLAIVLEREVESAPVLVSPIAGGRIRITLGGFKDPIALMREAKELAQMLKSRAMSNPVQLLRVERRPAKK